MITLLHQGICLALCCRQYVFSGAFFLFLKHLLSNIPWPVLVTLIPALSIAIIMPHHHLRLTESNTAADINHSPVNSFTQITITRMACLSFSRGFIVQWGCLNGSR